jgi:CDGSH-type Zn-finger protein/uncharacterized Fe-S cluster protein YjdI
MIDSEGTSEREGTAPRGKRYFSLSILVDYDAKRCIHAAECIRGLPAVFDTNRRPWILPSAAEPDAIAAVVQRCPSGALHFSRTDGGPAEAAPEDNTIVPRPRGPLYVRGRVQLRAPDGRLLVEDTRLSLCRCGQSRNKPFCDNSHRAAGFADPGSVAGGGDALGARGGLTITAQQDGPLLVEGALSINDVLGENRYLTTRVELCRCGGSANKPFCDGTHESIGFRSE